VIFWSNSYGKDPALLLFFDLRSTNTDADRKMLIRSSDKQVCIPSYRFSRQALWSRTAEPISVCLLWLGCCSASCDLV